MCTINKLFAKYGLRIYKYFWKIMSMNIPAIDFNFTLGAGHGVQRVGQECEEWTKSAKSGPVK